MTGSSSFRALISAPLLFGFVLGASGGLAYAEPTAAQKSAIRSACQSDYGTYCSGVPAGGSASLNCLQKNLASLSPSCQAAVKAVSGSSAAAPAEETQPATKKTTEPTTKKSAQPAAKTTAQPTAKLSPREEIRFIRCSCGADFRSLCGGVRLGGGKAIACLKANAASLSSTCRRALATLAR